MKNINILLVVILFSNKIFSQPCTKVEELNRKRHKIEGSTYGHPYTMFDKHNGYSFIETINNIRKNIIIQKNAKEQPVYTAYKKVYEFAESTKPTDDGLGPKGDDGKYTGISSLAIWAKCNAFVFLIGLDANGNKFDVLSSMFEVIQTHFPFLKTQLS